MREENAREEQKKKNGIASNLERVSNCSWNHIYATHNSCMMLLPNVWAYMIVLVCSVTLEHYFPFSILIYDFFFFTSIANADPVYTCLVLFIFFSGGYQCVYVEIQINVSSRLIFTGEKTQMIN